MNGKKARMLRKQSGFDPKKERTYKPLINGRGFRIKSTQKAVGSRRKYLDAKKNYLNNAKG